MTITKSEPLKKGSIIEGIVKSITNYGAFIDLGDIDGLLHISQISHQMIDHPVQVLSPGQIVKVVVLSIDESKKRVRLGRKTAIEATE